MLDANGFVGSELLNRHLNNPAYSEIMIVVRHLQTKESRGKI